MEEYEKATIEVVEMGTTAFLVASATNAPKKSNGIPDDTDRSFDVIP